MIIDIDSKLVTPEVMTKIAWLKDSIRDAVVDEGVVNGEHSIVARPATKELPFVKSSIVVARNYYAAMRYMQKANIDRDSVGVMIVGNEELDNKVYQHMTEVLLHVVS